MIETATDHHVEKPVQSFRERYQEAYRWMLLGRILDEKFASLYRGGKIHGGVFIGRGQEALSVSMGYQLRKTDIFAPLIRDCAGRLAFGEPPLDAARTYLGSPLGPMRAREGNVHRGRPKEGMVPMISHLGATVSVVNGMLMARRMRGVKDVVGAASIGDGATSTGAVHEALNQAAVENLPLVLVVADNQFAYSTPTDKQYACETLVDRAKGYGIGGHEMDGTDLAACLETLETAINAARAGNGPQLVVANLLRLCGHGEHDDAGYIGDELKKSALGRDCLELAHVYIADHSWATESELSEWRKIAMKQVSDAVEQAQRDAGPDPFREEWCAISSKNLLEIYPAV
jgi:pyruvate dehydrogenase E1 component alpha subunit/2-oxoisovalerate dehydrogenase E1 component alpha subunit